MCDVGRAVFEGWRGGDRERGEATRINSGGGGGGNTSQKTEERENTTCTEVRRMCDDDARWKKRGERPRLDGMQGGQGGGERVLWGTTTKAAAARERERERDREGRFVDKSEGDGGPHRRSLKTLNTQEREQEHASFGPFSCATIFSGLTTTNGKEQQKAFVALETERFEFSWLPFFAVLLVVVSRALSLAHGSRLLHKRALSSGTELHKKDK